MYPNTTLPTTFSNPSHRPPCLTNVSDSHSKLEKVGSPQKSDHQEKAPVEMWLQPLGQ